MIDRISRNALLEYIEKEQIAYQFGDGLLSFTHAGSDEEMCGDYEIEDIKDCIVRAPSIKEVKPYIEDISCFEDLVRWSQDSDLLILVNNNLLLCAPQKDSSRFLLKEA